MEDTPQDPAAEITPEALISPEAPEDTVEDIGETAIASVIDDLSSDAGTDTRIENPDLALEAAHAEKPFREAQIEQKDKLSPEDQELLDWLASEAAEKAISEYVEAKSKMSEVEAVLREKADRIKSLSAGRESVEDFGKNRVKINAKNEEEKIAIAIDTQAIVDKIVDSEVEAILEDSALSGKEQLDKIAQLVNVAKEASEVLRGTQSGPYNVEDIIRSFEHLEAEEVVAMLKGHAAAAIASGNIFLGIDALKIIAKTTESDVHVLIDSLLPEISKARNEHLQFAPAVQTDSMMEGNGYVWSNTSKKYVRVAE